MMRPRTLSLYRLAVIIGCITLASSPVLVERMEAGKTEVRNLDACEEYIQAYHQAAIHQQTRHRIPASITLAQGILESSAGKSYLAIQGNNHFGIKCGNWTGDYLYKQDDGRLERFRKYTSVEQSYEDHSHFIADRAHYKSLFELKPTDYVGWAHGLKRCGYASDPKYASKLIELIERYELHAYDLASASSSEPIASRPARSVSTPSAPAKRPATSPEVKPERKKPAETKPAAATQLEPGTKPTAHGIKVPKKSKPEAAAPKAQKEPAAQPAPAKPAPKKEAAPAAKPAPAPKADAPKPAAKPAADPKAAAAKKPAPAAKPAPAPKADAPKPATKPAADPKAAAAAKKPAPADAKKPAPAPKADAPKPAAKPAADPKAAAAAKKPAPADAKKPAPAPKADAPKPATKPAADPKAAAAVKKPATAVKKSAIASAKKPVATKKAVSPPAAKKPAPTPKKQSGKLVASSGKSKATPTKKVTPKDQRAPQAKKPAASVVNKAKTPAAKPAAKPATKSAAKPASKATAAKPTAKPAAKTALVKKTTPQASQKKEPKTPQKTSTLRRQNNNERPTVHTARRQRLERRRA